MPHQLLKENIKKNVQFSEEEQDFFCSFFDVLNVRKKEFLLRKGDVCKFEGFVTQGCFKIFAIDQKGNENILYFASKDRWLVDIGSFLNQIPSDLFMQAIDDSVVLVIDKKDKEHLYNVMPKVEKLFRIMSQKSLATLYCRLIQNQSLSAEERYHHFIFTHPEIALKLTNFQIASYLGITHEFVSRIKRKGLDKLLF